MANNINILGDLVSADAVKKVEDLAKAVESIAVQSEKFIANLNKTSGDNSKPIDTSKQEQAMIKQKALSEKLENEIKDLKEKNEESIRKLREENATKLAKLQEQLDFQREKRAQSTAKSNMTTADKVDRSYSIAQEKLEAQAVSQLATELQRLYAQQELANREAQKIALTIGLESTEFFEASKKAKDLTAEIIKLETATGKMSGKATNTNHALFSLTQVMRELPNFAMSARIGFMSLSNNLPQLVDGFTMLKNSVDETGKKLGSIGALKTFASSLLSLNTVVIIATTLMVTYGDSIFKWIEGMFKAIDVTDQYSLATKTLVKVFSDTSSQANKTTERLIHLGVAIDKYKSGTLDASEQTKQSNWIVKEYNETLGVYDKQINNVTQAIDGYNLKAKKFIEYTINMNASMLSIQESANQLQRARGAEVEMNALIPDKKTQAEVKQFFDAQRQYYIDIYTLQGKTKEQASNQFANDLENSKVKFNLNSDAFGQSLSDIELEMKYKKLLNKVDEDVLESYLKRLTIKQVATNKANKARETAEFFYQHEVENTNNKTMSSTVQTARTKLIAEEFYDKQRIELVKKMAQLEEDISKERLDGTLNDFKVREESNVKYLESSIALAEIDKEVAIKNLSEKTNKELSELRKIDEENQKKRKAGKINDDELERANAINAKSEENLIANHEVELLKIRDEFEKKSIDSRKKYAQQEKAIIDDLYEYEKYQINQTLIAKKASSGLETEKEVGKLTPNVGASLLSGVSGFKADTSMSESYIRQKQRQLDYTNEIISLQEQKQKLLDLGQGYGEKALALDRQIQEKQKEQITQKNEWEVKNLTEVEKRKSEIAVELADKTQQLIMQLIKNSFDKQLKALEKRNEVEKTINDERYKDVEDREKAGVITKQQAEDEKARIDVYAKGQEEQIAREKLEIQKKQFYFEQGIALAQTAMSTAQGIAGALAIPLGAGLPLIPLIASLGAVQAAMILSQQPPAFKDGGEMPYDGMALVGDGGKNEVLITPDGKIGITPNRDTYMNLEKGTKILPDVNKLNLDSLVAYMNIEKSSLSTKVLETEIKGLRKDMRNKKTATFSNTPMMRSIEFAKNIERRANNL